MKPVGLTIALFGAVLWMAGCREAAEADKQAKPEKQPAQTPPPPGTVAAGSAASHEGFTVDLGGGVKMELVLIPAGEFLMGTPKGKRGSDENPQHRVKITKPFYLGTHEVTQQQWQTVMGNNPSLYKGPKNPVERVSWDDCQAFLKKVNQRSGGAGRKYALPTEAQWECACRAGTSTPWSFGNDEARLGEYAWFYRNSGRKTHPVRQKQPNAWGLYDMHGNVWEWCSDLYDSSYYEKSPGSDPPGQSPGSYYTHHVYRGGGWGRRAEYCRSAQRNSDAPGHVLISLGFRVACRPAGE